MSSRILIGTDEAGYGPNLGPLTVTATAWRVPAEVEPASLWEELSKVITNAPIRGDSRLFVADSKSVYSSGDGLEDLEVPVLAFLKLLSLPVTSIDAIGTAVAGQDFAGSYQEEIWNNTPGLSLPRDASEDHIHEWMDQLRDELGRQDIHLLAVRSCIMFPREFNRRTLAAGSKGAVLSAATLQLVGSMVADFCESLPTLVVCDKHGGRNRYDEIISAQFDDQFVFRLEESTQRSRYRMGSVEFCFRTKAEELMPVALASMVSKYLREVLMHQFNQFWAAQVPGLKPTQGYPVDAKRFREDIAAAVEKLGVQETDLWRMK